MIVFLVVVIVLMGLTILAMAAKMRKISYQGEILVFETDEKKTFSIEPFGDIDKLDQRTDIRLKVVKASLGGPRE